ncbi:MAG: PucR family transcriptional regulator, partial [Actinobacteria bacterium]|nr:PucR family transcriptional regulator [Actinomycetota bacterium]
MTESSLYLSAERLDAERAVLARRVHRMTGSLTSSAMARMEESVPWFQALSANERASVGTIVEAGVNSFVDWFGSERIEPTDVGKLFANAPRGVVRALSLQQTVELVRTIMAVVEESVADVAGDNRIRQAYLRESLLRYSREIAFAAAEVFATAAESRGAWDARLQDLMLDAIISDEQDHTIESRALAAGWRIDQPVTTLVGPVPQSRIPVETHIEQIRRTARNQDLDVLVGIQSNQMIIVLGASDISSFTSAKTKTFLAHFGSGTVISGPTVENVKVAHQSLSPALSAFQAAALVTTTERLMNHDELLSARVLNGDRDALRPLIEQLQTQIRDDVRATLATYLEESPSIEG